MRRLTACLALALLLLNAVAFAAEAPQGEPVQVIATAYSAHDPGNSARTATGTLVRRGVIAVDPDFLPLGSLVFIPGYGNAAAEDVGGGVRGNLIDIAFDTHEEALRFGRRSLTIYVLRRGY